MRKKKNLADKVCFLENKKFTPPPKKKPSRQIFNFFLPTFSPRRQVRKIGQVRLELGKFKFSDFLDCKDIPRTTDIQMRLSGENICLQQHIWSRYWLHASSGSPRYWFRVNLLGPCGRIGQGYITGIFGKEYRVAHSGTRFSSVSKEYTYLPYD